MEAYEQLMQTLVTDFGIYKIRQMIEQEKQSAIVEVIEQAKHESEEPAKKGMKINEEFEKAVNEMFEENKRKYVKPEICVYEEEPEQIITPKRTGLKPKALISQDTYLEYRLDAEELVVMGNGRYIGVSWEDLPILIEELQEIKRIGEAG